MTAQPLKFITYTNNMLLLVGSLKFKLYEKANSKYLFNGIHHHRFCAISCAL